jgi:hypothetical protein
MDDDHDTLDELTKRVTPMDEVTKPVTGPSNKQAGKHISPEQAIQLIELIDGGLPMADAAAQVQIGIRTAYRVIAQADQLGEDSAAAVRKLMRVKALDVLGHWHESMPAAIKKGNHAPMRDYLLHAGAIEPAQTDGPVTRIAIMIGTDERPMHVRAPQVVDGELVADSDDEGE